jgi:hypothetical protein
MHCGVQLSHATATQGRRRVPDAIATWYLLARDHQRLGPMPVLRNAAVDSFLVTQ